MNMLTDEIIMSEQLHYLKALEHLWRSVNHLSYVPETQVVSQELENLKKKLLELWPILWEKRNESVARVDSK